MDTPISLEDLCYLHIISHLEDYPIHNLAKLSHRVRTRLLQNLPASDIIELENTCVADRISDLENKVWKQGSLCERLYGQTSRQSFFSAACSTLFSSQDKQLLEMLFSVPKCLGIADLMSFTSVVCDDVDRLVPHRYAALFDRNITSQCEFHVRVIILLNKACLSLQRFKPGVDLPLISTADTYVKFQSLLVLLIQSISLYREIRRPCQSSKLSV